MTFTASNSPAAKKATEEWARRYFRDNPGASVTRALKAANNQRVPPAHDIFARIHREMAAARLQAMQTLPAKPESAEGPHDIVTPYEPDVEVHPEEEPTTMPSPPSVESEKEMITTALRHLQAAMRAHNLATVTVIATDDKEFESQVEVTRKSTNSFTIKL